MLPTTVPYQYYTDLDGDPLDAGRVYFGEANTNPVTNPIPVFWDTAGTQPAAQPIRTLNGYPVRFGTPGIVYANSTYSVAVYDKKGRLVYTHPDSSQYDALATYVSDLASQTDTTKGASLVGYKLNETGSVGRTVSNKLSEFISVKDFGAVGDGVTDDSAAFTLALAVAAPLTIFVPKGNYLIKNVIVPTHRTIEGDGAIFKPAVGANFMFKMTGFSPTIRHCYFDGSNGNLVSSIGVNGAVVVENASYPTVENCKFVNVNTGLCLRATTETTKGVFQNLFFDTITQRGIYVGTNVNTCTFSNIRMYVGVEMPDNRPRRGCIGFHMVSTGGITAVGGHMLEQVDIEQAEVGFLFVDAQLSQIVGCFGDSLADAGFRCSGACSFLKFVGCLAGTCLVGFAVDSTSNNIYIDSATTILNGVVPPWWVGPGAFYVAGSPFDIAVYNTATVTMGSWFGDDKVYADPTATLKFEGGDYMQATTTTGFAAGSTAYFSSAGLNAIELFWIAPRDGVLFSLDVLSGTAPGAGQTYTYTARVNGVDTGLTFTTANPFSGGAGRAPVVVTRGQKISVKLVTSAAAAVTSHMVTLSIKYVR